MNRAARLSLLLCGALIWLLGALVSAPAADAHAELVRSVPAEGARLSAVPAHVTRTFSEGIAVQQCTVRAGGRGLPIY